MTSPEPDQKPPASTTVAIPRWALFVAGGVVALIILVVLSVVAFNAITASIAEAEAKAEAEAAAAALEERHDSLFKDAIRACKESADLGGDVNVRDGGESLDMNGSGRSDLVTYLEFEHQKCILNELDVPASVLDRMGSTRALDGTQDAEWDDLIVRWNYHPDSGMNIIVEFTG